MALLKDDSGGMVGARLPSGRMGVGREHGSSRSMGDGGAWLLSGGQAVREQGPPRTGGAAAPAASCWRS